MALRVLVTRPEAQAREWVERLHARGVDAAALPLIGIGPPADPGAVDAAWSALDRHAAVVFVSPNAADRFFAAGRRPWPKGVIGAAPGPGTLDRLREAGVPAPALLAPPPDAPQFDSESLWPVLRPHLGPNKDLLIVRGDGGREWLADQARAAGAAVDVVSAYRRTDPAWGLGERALFEAALAAPATHVWLFSSSDAIDRLGARLPPGTDTAAMVAVATHPRIAERARAAGLRQITACRPDPEAVVACIQSIRS